MSKPKYIEEMLEEERGKAPHDYSMNSAAHWKHMPPKVKRAKAELERLRESLQGESDPKQRHFIKIELSNAAHRLRVLLENP